MDCKYEKPKYNRCSSPLEFDAEGVKLDWSSDMSEQNNQARRQKGGQWNGYGGSGMLEIDPREILWIVIDVPSDSYDRRQDPNTYGDNDRMMHK
ncbi:gsr1990 [Gloeobacter violaceus PCC 7421]|uniref:Gsr1990 protein n=1 Tax=Gloeobacter violaceus (strain ATCC 29082 / PCC 7421) TaxID=251221 RepID=Q7NJ42_GLOVI|nr:gsr1990 [Gloeobacter violaceus PCC 7421]